VTLALIATVVGCNSSDEPNAFLPEAPEGWTTGPSSTFVGDELFMWINGGAEIYHEYGFESVEVRDYERGKERLSVEVYTMEGSAFGIYSWARSTTGETVDLGSGGTLADYYLHFWSGPHLVVVTAQNPGPDPQGAVLDLGRRIGAQYPRDGSLLKLVELIPADHCPQEATTYFVGPIAFNNVAPRLAPLFSGFEDGVVAQCHLADGDTEQLVFLRWIDPQHAAEAIERAADRIAITEGTRFEVVDDANFTLYFDTGAVVAGFRLHPTRRTPDHILRITMAEGHRPKLDENGFWCRDSRRSE